jgi:D-alanyl-D-alanine carboxypeptidase
VEQVIIHVNVGLNKPFYTDIKTIDNPNDQLVLCNKYNKLPNNFTPANLVSVPKGYYVNDGKDYRLDSIAMAYFKSMADDAKKHGINLKIISGYRTYNYQANLYNSSAVRNGKAHADKYVARAGHSEHETGLAVDINSVSEWFEDTKEFQWLQNNAHLYGFILRYPKGKEHITGFGYEPWHYRFVGVEVAKEIKEKDITFDEYCAKYIKQTDYVTS